MNPNQPNQPPQPPTDMSYLDQIAPKTEKTNPIQQLRPVHMIVGGALLIVLIMIIVGVVSAAMRGPLNNLERLAARLQTTATLAGDATEVLKSSELRTLNSNLKIFLTNTNRDITEPFASVGVNVKSVNKSIAASESGIEIAQRLEDARLNAVYDRTYAREMAYQLDTILALMKKSYDSIGKQSVKDVLETSYANLAPVQEAFADFNATNG